MLEDDTLALILLYERYATKEKSRWATYISALPAAYDLPFCWSDEEVEALAGTGLYPVALRMRMQLEEDFGSLVSAVKALPKKEDDVGFAAFRENFSLASYQWAICTVWSRGVSLKISGGYVKTLAPFFDMFNTSEASRVRHFYDPKRRALVVESEQGWAVGEQVCLNYGHRSSRTLIQLHGFVLPGAKAERYQLEMKFRGGGGKGTPAYDDKLALHRLRPPSDDPFTPKEEQGMLAEASGDGVEGGGGLFANFQLWEGVWPEALFRFLRIQMADPATLGELGDTLRKDINGQCDVELEVEVLRLLSSSIIALLKALDGEGGEESDAPQPCLDKTRDAAALKAIMSDATIGKARILDFLNALRLELGRGALKPLTAEMLEGDLGGREEDWEEEEDDEFQSAVVSPKNGGKGSGGKRGGGKQTAKGSKGKTGTTSKSEPSSPAVPSSLEASTSSPPSGPASENPVTTATTAPPADPPLSYSLAVTDSRERRIQLAAYLRYVERRILESHLAQVEHSMEQLRTAVEGFYKGEVHEGEGLEEEGTDTGEGVGGVEGGGEGDSMPALQ